jgi:hypothetical protein
MTSKAVCKHETIVEWQDKMMGAYIYCCVGCNRRYAVSDLQLDRANITDWHSVVRGVFDDAQRKSERGK